MLICWGTERSPLPKQCINFILVFCVSVVCLLPLRSFAAVNDDPFPFVSGEKLTYTVRWEMVNAGKAVFRVRPNDVHKDVKRRHFELNVKSNRVIDWIYKVRDRMEGFTDIDLTRSVLYRKKQSGKERRRIKVDFDWEQKTAVYTNFGRKKDPISILDQTFDPVSAFYKMRTIDFKSGQTLSFPVTDGKKCFIQYAHIKEKQTIVLPSGSYDTFLIIPEVKHFSGVFKKSKNPTVRLWVTADKRKIPVRVKVKVVIGSVICDLVTAK